MERERKEVIENQFHDLDVLFSEQKLETSKIIDICQQLETIILKMQEEKNNSDMLGQYKDVFPDKFLSNLNCQLDENQIRMSQQQNNQYQDQFQNYFKQSILQNKLNEYTGYLQRLKEKVFLIIGESGTYKDHFIQNITNNPNAQVYQGKDSFQTDCQIFQNEDGLKFLDSPGLNGFNNDLQKMNNNEIFLTIVKYLYNNSIKLQDIFIIYISDNNLNSNLIIEQLGYVYFLYGMFQEELSQEDLDQLMKEFDKSQGLLNWCECGFSLIDDKYTSMREIIYQNKDFARDIIEQYLIGYLREQSWFNSNNNQNNYQFDQSLENKEYIEYHKYNLFYRIIKLIQQQDMNKNIQQNKQTQNILLIGKSHIKKYYLIEQIIGLRGLREYGQNRQYCQFYIIEKDDIYYRFIDTPDDFSKEDQTNSQKSVIDFLRRNNIQQFKVIFLEEDYRHESRKVMEWMLQLIHFTFNNKFSFVKPEIKLNFPYLFTNYFYNEEWEIEQKQDVQDFLIQLLKESILSVELVFSKHTNILDCNRIYQRHGNDYQTLRLEIYQDDLSQQGYFQFGALPVQDIQIQQQILLQGLNNIKNIREDQLFFVQLSSLHSINYKVIENATQLNRYLNLLYLDLDYLFESRQERSSIALEDVQHLKNVQLKVMKNSFYAYLNSNFLEQNFDILDSVYMKEICMRFIQLNKSSILFEQNQYFKNANISRMQKFFSSNSHLLSRFIQREEQNKDKMDQKSQEILESLSRIQVYQEIHYFQKIKSLYVENNDTISNFLYRMDSHYINLKSINSNCISSNYTNSNECLEYYQRAKLFFKDIIEDTKPNQQLHSFQKLQLLKKLNVSSYSQLLEGRQSILDILSKDNLSNPEQFKILRRLFHCPNINELRNIISRYIVKKFICSQFQKNFLPNYEESEKMYFNRVLKSLEFNNQLLTTYYYRYEGQVLYVLQQETERLKKKIQDNLKMKSEVNKLDKEYYNVLSSYVDALHSFNNQIIKEKISYNQQYEYANGLFRWYQNPFDQLLNSYCNLIQLKTEIIYQQPIISDLDKDEINTCFIIKDQQNSFNNFIKQDKYFNSIELTQIILNSTAYIYNRYLNKLKDQTFNLSHSSKSEMEIYSELEYSYDLHDLAETSMNFNIFKNKISELAKEFIIDSERNMRLKEFYESVEYLTLLFQKEHSYEEGEDFLHLEKSDNQLTKKDFQFLIQNIRKENLLKNNLYTSAVKCIQDEIFKSDIQDLFPKENVKIEIREGQQVVFSITCKGYSKFSNRIYYMNLQKKLQLKYKCIGQFSNNYVLGVFDIINNQVIPINNIQDRQEIEIID